MYGIKELKFFSTKSLARYLGEPEAVLLRIANEQAKHYRFKQGVLIKNKKRDFYVPDYKLNRILKKVDKKILNKVNWPKSFVGGIKGRDLKMNAKMHSNQTVILKVDIKEFYPSITPDNVKKALSNLGIKNEPLSILTRLMTVKGEKPHLPQGFCTSPKIAALVLLPIDRRLHGIKNKHEITYSFWIDDLTISGKFSVGRLKNLVVKIIKEEGFECHKIKTLTQRDRMVVTGVIVNKFPNIKKEQRQKIESTLSHLLRSGLEGYLIDKEIKVNEENLDGLKNYLLGTVHQIISINPELGAKYKKKLLTILERDF